MTCCVAAGCPNKKRPSTTEVSYHSFPLRNPVLLKEWLRNLKREGFRPTKNSKLCSQHFLPNCYKEDRYTKFGITVEQVRRKRLGRILVADAVPTEFPVPPSSSKPIATTTSSNELSEKHIKQEMIVTAVDSPGVIKTEMVEVKPDPRIVLQQNPRIVLQPDPRIVLQPDPREVLQQNPQKVSQPDPQRVLQPDPQEVLQPDPQKVLQPDPQKVLQPDPKQVLQLDPRKVLQELCKLPGINASYLTGLNPSELVVLDPGQVKGFDPSQAYRAVYIPEGRCLSQLLGLQQDIPEPEELGSSDVAHVPEQEVLRTGNHQAFVEYGHVPEPGDLPEQQKELFQQIVQEENPDVPPTSITEDGENLIKNLETLHRLLFSIKDVKKSAMKELHVTKSMKVPDSYKVKSLILTLESFMNEIEDNLSDCITSMIDAVQLQQTQYLKFTQGVKKLQQQEASLREEMDKIDSLKMENSQLCRRIKVMMKQRQTDQICGINQNSRKRPKWLDFYQQTLFKYHKRTERRDLLKFQKEIQKVKGKCLSLSLIKDSSSLCKKYTGIPNYSMLKSLFYELNSDPDCSTPVQSGESNRKRTMSLENELFLTLIKIKLDLPVTHLSRQFKVRPGVVREILYKWTPVLIRTMEKLKQDPDFKSITLFWTLLKRFIKRKSSKPRKQSTTSVS